METETKRTNKTILIKGIKTMALSLICMFAGPTLLYIAFSNTEKPLYIPILLAALFICGLAIYFAFKGLKTIMDSMFQKQN
ncbi:DUF6095 family protein [Mangrovimonas sp. TPBH4]|uniref:DUF6095 family protein n=1 Tax=Mangrovimonas sp. TPBH4 TaxID=1645914 RepID=UPI0006B5112E|nr:DUF6095 family protein [Mangrovimonas sp. TPBH4]